MKRPNEGHFAFIVRDENAKKFEFGPEDDIFGVLETNTGYHRFETQSDFFGILEPTTKIETKKTMILEIYKFVFRFSISKLISNIEDELFLTVFFQYLKETKM